VHEVVVTNIRETPAMVLPKKLKMAKAGARLRAVRSA